MGEIKECLIIDDDEDDQEIFVACINAINKHINCQSSCNGIDALRLLEENPDYKPEYIFVDINMPKMGGIECLRALKAMSFLKDAKIYMYSTTAEKSVVLESQKLGAIDFVIKPAKIDELKEKLAEIFGTTF